jgi:hypothetical protein
VGAGWLVGVQSLLRFTVTGSNVVFVGCLQSKLYSYAELKIYEIFCGQLRWMSSVQSTAIINDEKQSSHGDSW